MTTITHTQALGKARELYEAEFGPIPADARVLAIHAPGRSEISGNHTDHEGGHVIAGALDVSVDGIAVANGTNTVRIADEGYPTFSVELDDLDVREDEVGTSASLVRGMAHEIAAHGGIPVGFDFAFVCTVPSGGGLSSSAAVEAAYGRAMEALWDAPAVDPVTNEPAHREQLLRQAVRPHGPGSRVPGRALIHGLRERPTRHRKTRPHLRGLRLLPRFGESRRGPHRPHP